MYRLPKSFIPWKLREHLLQTQGKRKLFLGCLHTSSITYFRNITFITQMPIPLTYFRVPGFTHPTIHLPIIVCYACTVCNLQYKQRCVGKSLHIQCCSPYANTHPQGFKASFVDRDSRCVKVIRSLRSTRVYWYHSFDVSLIAKRMAPRVDWPLREEHSVKAEDLTILCYILRRGFHPELES